MTTGQLVLIIALVLVAAVLVVLILRRGSQRREEHRVEAEELRSEAQEVAASTTGLAAFAEQAEERAGVARAEAEEKVAEAERLEAEAAGRQRAAEQTRQEYEAMMRRADDVDPDVKESQYPPVAEGAGPEPAAEREQAEGEAEGPPAGDATPMTRAERRRAREEAEARESEEASWSSGPAAPVAGAAAAAAVGTAAWAAHDDEATDEERERSERIASAADYRDDTEPSSTVSPDEAQVAGGAEGGRGAGSSPDPDSADVWTPSGVGTGDDMSGSPRAATSATADEHDTSHGDVVAADAAADAESPRGEWGGPPDGGATEAPGDAAEDTPSTQEGTSMTERTGSEQIPESTERDDAREGVDTDADLTMVKDPDAYASTEPVLAEDQAPPVEPEKTERTGTGLLDRDPGDTEGDAQADGQQEDPAAAGAAPDAGAGAESPGADAVILDDSDTDAFASTEPVLADGSHAEARPDLRPEAADDADEPGTADDPGADDGIVAGDADDEAARDWGHDEGDLLDENRERGEQLAADREALDREAAAAEQHPSADDGDATDAAAGEPESADATRGRRISDFHEIRDGGYGMGSAAPLDDGAQPMDHPVAAYRDTMSFRSPGDPGYDDVDPDVWFYDEAAAERSGFHRSDG